MKFQGRINYGPDAKDFKGIVSNVTLGGTVLTRWNMSGLALDDEKALERFARSMVKLQRTDSEAHKKVGRRDSWGRAVSRNTILYLRDYGVCKRKSNREVLMEASCLGAHVLLKSSYLQ